MTMSRFAEKVRRWYRDGIWTADMVRDAVTKGKITQAECDEILGGN